MISDFASSAISEHFVDCLGARTMSLSRLLDDAIILAQSPAEQRTR